MKKYIYFLTALVVSALTFTACSDDDNEEQVTQNPEKEVVGTYVGSWHQEIRNSSEELTEENDADGTVYVTAEKQWVTKVVLSAAAPVVKNEKSQIANCSGNNKSGYIMTNTTGPDDRDDYPTIANFTARVKDGVITLTYKLNVLIKRKKYTQINTFVGTITPTSPVE